MSFLQRILEISHNRFRKFDAIIFKCEHQGSVITGTFKSAMQPHCSLYRQQSASF